MRASHAQGASVVAVCSGANINFDRLRLVAELADLGAHVRPPRPPLHYPRNFP